jgi:hypothetical protein
LEVSGRMPRRGEEIEGTKVKMLLIILSFPYKKQPEKTAVNLFLCFCYSQRLRVKLLMKKKLIKKRNK